MKRIFLNDINYETARRGLCSRTPVPPEIEDRVKVILEEVRTGGDRAVAEFLERFDGVRLDPSCFRVTEEEIREAERLVSPAERRAIGTALRHVAEFAKRTRPKSWTFHPRPGVTLGEQFHPMDRVACYVPGGTAPLVSTAVHTVGVAKAAGVRCVAAMTPPMKDGKVNPKTLYALHKAGADEIWKFGGAYAVAALAYGTETVKKAEMIAGPGNAYVAAAKKLVYGSTAIDMVAGPSEIMVIAEGCADPSFAAADILSQAEHGSGLERAVLVSDSASFLEEAERRILSQAETLKRQGPLRKVLENGVSLIQVRDMNDAAELAGDYAPEHLEIHCRNAGRIARKVKSAGAIFLGEWTPEPAGDFTAGPSHVLPTGGTAKFFHGLTCSDFMRRSSILRYTKEALRKEIPYMETIALLEGLDAHARSAGIRREDSHAG